MIDFAIRYGMTSVLKTLEDDLEREISPDGGVFSKRDADQMLFDNRAFSRTKDLQWGLQLLARMQKSIYNLLVQIDDFEKTKLERLRDAAYEHRIRASARNGNRRNIVYDRSLVSEKAFRSKLELARHFHTRVDAKYSELKDMVC